MTTKKPYELKGEQLKAYRRGFLDRASGSYFPGGLDAEAYDRGYKDGAKNAPRKDEKEAN
jgi:hypothetical protein